MSTVNRNSSVGAEKEKCTNSVGVFDQRLRNFGAHVQLDLPGRIATKEIVSVKKLLGAKYAALPVSVSDILDQFPTQKLSFGCSKLDGLVGGGLERGQVLEVCGVSATGKTQLCLAACASTLTGGGHVVYADTKGDFSASRCRQILRSRGVQPQECVRLLSRLHVASCGSAEELLALLETVRSGRGQLQRRLRARLRLLVVDSAAAVAAPLLSAPQFRGFGTLSALATTLKSLAVDCRAAVLVTNRVVLPYPGRARRVRPALGLAWRSVPHVRLLVRRQVLPSGGGGKQLRLADTRRTALVVRNVGGPCGQSIHMVFTERGVECVECVDGVEGERAVVLDEGNV